MKPDKHHAELVAALHRFKRSHDQVAMRKLIQKATEGKASTISEIPQDRHIYTRVIAACKTAPLTGQDLARELRAFAKKNGVVKTMMLLHRTVGADFQLLEEKIPPSDYSKIIDACGRINYYPDQEFEADTLYDVVRALDRVESRYGLAKKLAVFEKCGGLAVGINSGNIPRAMWPKIIRACRGIKEPARARARF